MKSTKRKIIHRHSAPRRTAHKSTAIIPAKPAALAMRPMPTVAEAIEKVLIAGDLSPLSADQRLEYYKATCRSLGLNPLTRPFDYIAFRETEDSQAKLVLYARRDCTDQLRMIHGVAVTKCVVSMDADFITAEVEVRDRTGRTDTGTGVIPRTAYSRKKQEWYELKGLALANARMKAETKGKRRATLSICGLGILDETELEGIEHIREVTLGGRIVEPVKPKDPRDWCDKHNCDISKCPVDGHSEAENEAMGAREQDRKYTPAQREVMEKKNAQMTPCLFYQLHKESGTYEITGADSLKSANKDLLGPVWNGAAKAIVATPEQLGKLISQFEMRKVPFREVQ